MENNYYQKYKERLRKEAHERYQNLSEDEKDKRGKKARERYQNFTKEKKSFGIILNIIKIFLRNKKRS